MHRDARRYFIELPVANAAELPRHCETEMRRKKAQKFLCDVSGWLSEQKLEESVASIAITAMGQVLMTCEQCVIHRLQQDKSLGVAVVRTGRTLSESVQRVRGW